MDIEKMLIETGIIYAEGQFRGEVDPPYIVYLTDGYDNICADGKVIKTLTKKGIELYHEKTDTESEKLLEAVLKAHEVNYSKGAAWISGDQQLYEKIYMFYEKENE